MNRRKFLTGLALSAGGILVGEELLKSKTYFLPPSGGWNKGLPIIYGEGAELWLDGKLIGRVHELETDFLSADYVGSYVGSYAGYMRQHL